MRLDRTVAIAASRQRVWDVMSDVVRWSEWTASITEIRPLDGEKLALGSRVETRQPHLPCAIWRVTDFKPGEGFVWESRAPGARTVGGHWITAEDGAICGVLVTVDQTGLLAATIRPFVSPLTRRYMEMEAAGLKRRCEELPLSAPSSSR